MPPRTSYDTLPILVKTGTLTIFLEAPPRMTVHQLKQDVLSALTSKVAANDLDVPNIHRLEDFELCRELKERGRVSTGKYELLEGKQLVKSVAVAYGHIFLRVREDGILRQPEYSLPPIQPEDDEPEPIPSLSKGKEKATF